MSESDFLFSMPSFLKGMGRTLDLFGTMDEYNTSTSPEEADSRALMQDGLAIKRDMSRVIKDFSEQQLT